MGGFRRELCGCERANGIARGLRCSYKGAIVSVWNVASLKKRKPAHCARLSPIPSPSPARGGRAIVSAGAGPVASLRRCPRRRRGRRFFGPPYGLRTRVLAFRGPRPGPLGEGGGVAPGRPRLRGQDEHTPEPQSLTPIPYS